MAAGMVLLVSSSVRAQPGNFSESKTTSRPVDSDAVPMEYSAERCLEIALELQHRDNYPRAKAWFQAALDRSQNKQSTDSAKLALERLELLGKVAPRLSVAEWVQGMAPSGPRLAGKVIVIFFFEIIDPDMKHDVLEMNALAARNEKSDFELIGIASVLGETEYQQQADIQQYLTDEHINFRVGIDDGGVLTLNTYKGKCVPHYAIIDRAGRVRRLGEYTPMEIDFTVRQFLAESPRKKLPGEHRIMPQSREGRELIDTPAPRLKGESWANTKDNQPPDILGKPRLIRFFMGDCPYCRASAPALSRIYEDYRDQGLAVIGVYHPKPQPRDVPDAEFRQAVRRLEFEFPCTVDADWSYLKKLWLEAGKGGREYSSVSFLIDRKGRIRYIHPGPDFFPSEDPAKSRQNEDYEAVRAAIEKVLSE